jgi:hypothetical protein
MLWPRENARERQNWDSPPPASPARRLPREANGGAAVATHWGGAAFFFDASPSGDDGRLARNRLFRYGALAREALGRADGDDQTQRQPPTPIGSTTYCPPPPSLHHRGGALPGEGNLPHQLTNSPRSVL